MIENLKQVLGESASQLGFKDEGHRVVVTVTGWLTNFVQVQKVMTEYNATYHPYDKATKAKAYWIVPKKQAAQPERMSGSVKQDVVSGLLNYALEAEKMAVSFRQMAEDLKKV